MTVEFDTRDYVRSHGKQPKGWGRWAFDFDGEWCFTPTAMNYAEAKAWVAEKARAAGARRVVVGP